MRKTNRDPTHRNHLPGEAAEHFVPKLDFMPDWFIDLGPGSGSEFLAVRKKWGKCKLLGLEPSKASFEIASERWPKDGVLLQAAAWDHDGWVALHQPDNVLHSSCFVDGQHVLDDDTSCAADVTDAEMVRARTLDGLNEEYGPFVNAALWMDIEGAERRALKGAATLLHRGAIRAVNVEVRPQYANDIGFTLLRAGFKMVYKYFECATVRNEIWLLKGKP